MLGLLEEIPVDGVFPPGRGLGEEEEFDEDYYVDEEEDDE